MLTRSSLSAVVLPLLARSCACSVLQEMTVQHWAGVAPLPVGVPESCHRLPRLALRAAAERLQLLQRPPRLRVGLRVVLLLRQQLHLLITREDTLNQ